MSEWGSILMDLRVVLRLKQSLLADNYLIPNDLSKKRTHLHPVITRDAD